jgi:diacylglycerol kinase (ATP)
MKKLLFVYNPHSGKGLIKNKLCEILDIFAKAGYEMTVCPTQHAMDGYDKVCEADGKYDLIVCSGGDGTLNEVISAVMTHCMAKPKIGYIPAGSTNDFAKSLGIPKDMVKAAKLISNDNSFLCDIGVMNGRFFNYVAAFGAFTDVSYKTPQSMKNVLGHQAYIVESLKSLSKIKAYNMKVTCNDITITGNYIYGMVANSKSVGGMKGITGKNILLDDGLFEVILVREAKNPLELQQIVAGLFSKNQDSPMVDRFKASKVIFESDKSISWTLDGEYADDHQLVEIDVCPKAIKIIKG